MANSSTDLLPNREPQLKPKESQKLVKIRRPSKHVPDGIDGKRIHVNEKDFVNEVLQKIEQIEQTK